jgi:hypothetical protein
MKKIDFTHAGGFPLTQAELDHLQQGYSECLQALAAMGSNSAAPIIINGMTITAPSPGMVTVSDGWFFYNNELIPFVSGTISVTGPSVALVVIAPATTLLTYNDGSTHGAVVQYAGSLVAGPALTNSTQFVLDDARIFQLAFGENGRESGWQTITVSTPMISGNVVGSIDYKKNILTNTLHIKGSLTANMAQNLPASPAAAFTQVGTLPAAYRPNSAAYFTSHYYAPNLFADDLGVGWVKHFTSGVNNIGQIFVNLIRPDVSITAYSVVFNTIVPLD